MCPIKNGKTASNEIFDIFLTILCPKISYWATFIAGPPNLFSPQILIKFSCPVVGVKSMCVQLGAEPGVHPQLYRFATLISLELCSSQAPPFLVHWLEIQSFHLPVLSYSSCDCLCYQFYGTWNSVIFPPNLLAYYFTFPCPPGATQCIFSRDFF